ncbi:hypothetical protein [Microbaculum marinum]|uniref:Uncharacterized protein n=1 Tax=Microbaculum marinum TaxID=1764581 RepID=A0AAW9RWF3_9HYPH
MKKDEELPVAPAASPAEPAGIQRQPDPDYEAVRAAVMETARGRWFLDEHARRNRIADTGTVLAAVERLEHAVQGAGLAGIEASRSDISDISAILARTRSQMAALPDLDPGGPTGRGAIWRETVALRAINTMGEALQRIEDRVNAIAAATAGEDETAELAPSARSGTDAAVGRFLKDIAAFYADDVTWADEGAGSRDAARPGTGPDPGCRTDRADRDAAVPALPSRRFRSETSDDPVANASDGKIVRLREPGSRLY